MLYVSNAQDARDLYKLLQNELKRLLPSHREDVNQLALVGVRHAALLPSRVTILGADGIDVPAVVSVIADGIGVPSLRIPLAMASGHGWQGAGVREFLQQLTDLPFGHRAFVIMDDLDVLGIPRGQYGASGASSQRAVDDLARAAVQVLAGAPVPPDLGRGPSIPTSELSVAITGEIDGLTRNPSTGDWIDLGFSSPIAAELGRMQLLTLAPLEADDVALTLLSTLDDLYDSYRILGYRLDVEPATLTYAAAALGRADYGGLSAAAGWLRRAATGGLIRLIEARAPTDSKHTITPDELEIPDPPRGKWVD